MWNKNLFFEKENREIKYNERNIYIETKFFPEEEISIEYVNYQQVQSKISSLRKKSTIMMKIQQSQTLQQH